GEASIVPLALPTNGAFLPVRGTTARCSQLTAAAFLLNSPKRALRKSPESLETARGKSFCVPRIREKSFHLGRNMKPKARTSRALSTHNCFRNGEIGRAHV